MKNWSAHSKFIFKKSVLLQILEDYNKFFCRTDVWGEEVASSCLQQRGEELREMSTLSLCINPLESSSKEHPHVYTWRTHKGAWYPAERVARMRTAAEVSSLLFTRSLTGVHTSRTSSSSHDDFRANTVWHTALCSVCGCIERFG